MGHLLVVTVVTVSHTVYCICSVLERLHAVFQTSNFLHCLKFHTTDNLWFDAEGEEFVNDFFDISYQNRRFDQNKIDVCQINIEIHITSDVPNRKREFMKFLKRLIQEKRYDVYFEDTYGHIRMYVFNYGSPYCLEKL